MMMMFVLREAGDRRGENEARNGCGAEKIMVIHGIRDLAVETRLHPHFFTKICPVPAAGK